MTVPEAAEPPVLTAEQCRAARRLLRWTRFDLALAAELRIISVLRLEGWWKPPEAKKIARLRRALEAGGVEFLPEDGVRLRERPTEAAS